MLSGAELIVAERQRHVAVEGYTSDRDDEYDVGELADAAIAYAKVSSYAAADGPFSQAVDEGCEAWPSGWDLRQFKPSTDLVRNLVKAGALIAAEIDRLQRLLKNEKASGAAQSAVDLGKC